MIKTLEDFKAYNLAMDLGERIWSTVITWDYFQKDTVGKQLVKAADSIAANLSEGLGRYHFKEIKNFGYYSRGSLFETKTWLTKSHSRALLDDVVFDDIQKDLEVIGKMINRYIASVGNLGTAES